MSTTPMVCCKNQANWSLAQSKKQELLLFSFRGKARTRNTGLQLFYLSYSLSRDALRYITWHCGDLIKILLAPFLHWSWWFVEILREWCWFQSPTNEWIPTDTALHSINNTKRGASRIHCQLTNFTYWRSVARGWILNFFLEGPSSQTTCTRNRMPRKAFCWSHLGCIRRKFLKSWFHVIDDHRLKLFSSAGLPWSPTSNSLIHHECSQLTSTVRINGSG